jgi:hypothetical protein
MREMESQVIRDTSPDDTLEGGSLQLLSLVSWSSITIYWFGIKSPPCGIRTALVTPAHRSHPTATILNNFVISTVWLLLMSLLCQVKQTFYVCICSRTN